MREFGGIVAALWLAACSTGDRPAVAPRRTPQVEVESDIVLAPREPTPAFVPARDGACPHEYRLVDGSCVHHAYATGDDEALARALAAYKRGAVPPMLGPPKPVAPPPPIKQPLGPGALSKRTSTDAGAAQERRLAELDAMIAAAKEKLRERDERSRAKRVDSPRRARAAAAPELVPAPFVAAGGAAAPSPSAAADPTLARLSELSQLAGQLQPEQLQAITSQLTGAGMDARELQVLMNSALTGR
jgi:hypothetical protein